MYSTLIKYFTSCITLNSTEIETVKQSFTLKKVPKKTFLLREGEVCQSEAFVVKGCLKSYFIDQNGFEVILTFAVENWWVSDIASFQDQKPSKMFIETLEDCELLLLTPTSKEELLNKLPKLERVFRIMVQRHLAGYQERLFSNIALSAPERYTIFLQKYPDISQRVPQHLIASYLGISPEFLSKIRSKRKFS